MAKHVKIDVEVRREAKKWTTAMSRRYKSAGWRFESSGTLFGSWLVHSDGSHGPGPEQFSVNVIREVKVPKATASKRKVSRSKNKN